MTQQAVDIIGILEDEFNKCSSLEDRLQRVEIFVDARHDRQPVNFDINLMWRAAILQLKHNNPYTALPALKAATLLAPNDSATWYNFGVALYNIARDDCHEAKGYVKNDLLKRAQQTFASAYFQSETNPKYLNAYFRVSGLIQDYETVLQLEERLDDGKLDASGLTTLGIAHLYAKAPADRTQEDYSRALEYFTRAREVDLENAVHLVNLAEVHAAMGGDVESSVFVYLDLAINRHKMIIGEKGKNEGDRVFGLLKDGIEEGIRQRSYDSFLGNDKFKRVLNYFDIKPDIIKQEPYFKLLDDFDVDEALRKL